MRASESSMGGGADQFHTTRWTLVMASARDQSQTGRAALAALCQTYWYPLYAFARRRGHSPPDAQDLTQGFFLHILEHQALSHVDQLKGKFRSFLLACFQNYLSVKAQRAIDSSEAASASLFPLTWRVQKTVIDLSQQIF